MLCCRASLAYAVTMMMSSSPSDATGKAFQLLLPRHSWCGCSSLLFPSFVAWASCCAWVSALVFVGCAALVAPLLPTFSCLRPV